MIDWELIATHWRDLMRIALSIRDGRLSSTLLLRRLSSESRRNNVYKAFRELGRAICTITLLRLISEPELRAEIDAATNKVESYNQFSDWLAFGAEQLERNDPEQLEKLTKAGTLLANCVILHIALDMTDVVRDLQAAGHPVDPGRSGDDEPVHHRARQTVRRIPDRRARHAARSVRPAPATLPTATALPRAA